jgi:hypothetical protein
MITKEKIKKQAPRFYVTNLCSQEDRQWYLNYIKIIKGYNEPLKKNLSELTEQWIINVFN